MVNTVKKRWLVIGIALGAVLILLWWLNCEFKKVGPTPPPEFEFEEPKLPEVIPGEVDVSPSEAFCEMIQVAIDSQKVTQQLDAVLDSFTSMVGEEDLNYLAEFDSTAAAYIAEIVDSTGELPERIADIIYRLEDWGYLPTFTESYVSGPGLGQLSKVKSLEYPMYRPLDEYEKCVTGVTERYLQLKDLAAMHKKECYDEAKKDYEECKKDAKKRRKICLKSVGIACKLLPKPICKKLKAACWAGYFGSLAICWGARKSRERACNKAYEQSIATLDNWLPNAVARCHDLYGGGGS